MTRSKLISLSISASIAVLAAGVAISSQDKYALQVPNGLSFSEFRGCEDWPVIAISDNEGKLAVTGGNPANDRRLQGGCARQWQAFPGRRQNGEGSLDPEKTGDLSRSANRAGYPA